MAQLVINERILDDLVITCESDILARQDFGCSAQCGGTNEEVTWETSYCNSGPSSSTICNFGTSGSKTITATPVEIESPCASTDL
jgi:hypothetical protein